MLPILVQKLWRLLNHCSFPHTGHRESTRHDYERLYARRPQLVRHSVGLRNRHGSQLPRSDDQSKLPDVPVRQPLTLLSPFFPADSVLSCQLRAVGFAGVGRSRRSRSCRNGRRNGWRRRDPHHRFHGRDVGGECRTHRCFIHHYPRRHRIVPTPLRPQDGRRVAHHDRRLRCLGRVLEHHPQQGFGRPRLAFLRPGRPSYSGCHPYRSDRHVASAKQARRVLRHPLRHGVRYDRLDGRLPQDLRRDHYHEPCAAVLGDLWFRPRLDHVGTHDRPHLPHQYVPQSLCHHLIGHQTKIPATPAHASI